MSIDLAKLSQPFPADAISWRAQTMNKEGTSALALAYLTARDVMDRLDEVCGPANWQDRYEVHGDKTICYLSIRIGNEWIVKADGGGDSDVEGEKGALSGALKRAAVKWGIGRYLYDLGNTWVGCDHYEANRQGKAVKVWKRWTEDPWSKVRNRAQFLPSGNEPSSSPEPAPQPDPQKEKTPGGRTRNPGPRFTDEGDAVAICEVLIENALKQPDPDRLGAWWKGQAKQIGSLPDKQYDQFASAVEKHKAELLAQRVAS